MPAGDARLVFHRIDAVCPKGSDPPLQLSVDYAFALHTATGHRESDGGEVSVRVSRPGDLWAEASKPIGEVVVNSLRFPQKR